MPTIVHEGGTMSGQIIAEALRATFCASGLAPEGIERYRWYWGRGDWPELLWHIRDVRPYMVSRIAEIANTPVKIGSIKPTFTLTDRLDRPFARAGFDSEHRVAALFYDAGGFFESIEPQIHLIDVP